MQRCTRTVPTPRSSRSSVAPAARRSGVGRSLLDLAAERARELGASALHGAHATPGGAAFTRAVGAHDSGQRIVHSVLDLHGTELPEPEVPEGWRLVTWLERVPDEHLDAYVVARGAMADAPAPGELDYPVWDAEKIRASEQSLRARDREMRLTVAMHHDRAIGSFTELRVSRGSVSAFRDDTGTAASYRGLGLARAVKLESLRRLRADHPEVEVVTTSNAEENRAMLRINRSIGFRPTVIWTTATLRL